MFGRCASSSLIIRDGPVSLIDDTRSFSNTFSASVRRPSFFPVCLITAWSNHADSMMMFVVLSDTAESFPQIIHPRARTETSSAITISLDVSL
jgi:hypothetical protein